MVNVLKTSEDIRKRFQHTEDAINHYTVVYFQVHMYDIALKRAPSFG